MRAGGSVQRGNGRQHVVASEATMDCGGGGRRHGAAGQAEEELWYHIFGRDPKSKRFKADS